jgi:hypothetical protein
MTEPVIYSTAGVYLASKQSAREKIIAIDNIINLLLAEAANSAGTESVSEYSLDDGQSKIRTLYRGSAGVMSAIASFEKLKNYYVNQLNGRVVRLSDKTNFR